jgi:hypothetical protein
LQHLESFLALENSLPIDPEHLTEAGAAALAAAIASSVDGAGTRQEAAERIVQLLFTHLVGGGSGEPACVLVRCFHTSTYARMPLHYRDAADQLLDTVPPDALEQMRCLSLLATCGVRTVWNDVLTSVAHQAIPLPSVEVVRKAPMIARLFDDLGIPIERVVAPPDAPGFLLDTPTEFRVFHIPEALDSPFIPAQTTFVEPYGVRSVVGMGGVLPDGELVAVVLFTRVPIAHEVARRFGVVAAALRAAMVTYPSKSIFDLDDC